MTIKQYFDQLRRRNIFRVAGVYVVVSWLIIQLAIALETALNLPGWFDTVVTTLVLIGFPIAMIVTWGLELTPDGDVKAADGAEIDTTLSAGGRRVNLSILFSICCGAIFIIWQVIKNNDVDTVDLNADRQLSIAVLPFEDFSPGKDQDYFADGISEELLNSLAKIKDLHVTSRTSAFSFKGKDTPVSEIGEILGVAHVLEGSIRKAGSTLRITAQLINTQTDAHLWSETYDRTLSIDNIFAIQDEISAAIVTELKGKLKIDEIKPAAVPNSLLAFDLYLRARENMHKRTPESLQASIEDYQRVIELDNHFAPAFAGIANAYLLAVSYGDTDYEKSIARARDNVFRAIDLAPNAEETFIARASLAFYEDDSLKMIEQALKAIEVNPNSAFAYLRLGNGLLRSGSPLDALNSFDKSVELDPNFFTPKANRAKILGSMGNTLYAQEILMLLKDKFPSNHVVYLWSGVIHNIDGDYALGHTELLKAWVLMRESEAALYSVASYYTTLYLDIGIFNVDGTLFDREITLYKFLGEASSYRISISSYLRDEYGAVPTYMGGDYSQADILISDYRAKLIQPNAQPGMLTVENWIRIFMISQTVGHEGTELLGQRIQDYINKFPESVNLPYLALFAALKGDYSEAMTFLEDHVDAGHATWTLRLPVFDAVRETDRFKAIQQRNDDNAAAIRAIVFEQMEAYDRLYK